MMEAKMGSQNLIPGSIGRSPILATVVTALLLAIGPVIVSPIVVAAENTNRSTAEAVCQRGDVIFCENWEDGDTVGWTDFSPYNGSTHWGGSGCKVGSCDFPYMGYHSNRSLVLRLPPNSRDSMYPRAAFNTPVGTNDTVYLRFYKYWSPGFEFNTNINKNMYLESASLTWTIRFNVRPNKVGVVPPVTNLNRAMPTIEFYCGQIDVPPAPSWEAAYCYETGGQLDYWPNQPGFEDFHFETGRWYAIEMMVKPNPSGSSFGGHISAWVDGHLIIDYDNVSVRHANATDSISGIWATIYFGGGGQSAHPDQYSLYDDIVVSKSYIGPMTLANEPASSSPTKAAMPTP